VLLLIGYSVAMPEGGGRFSDHRHNKAVEMHISHGSPWRPLFASWDANRNDNSEKGGENKVGRGVQGLMILCGGSGARSNELVWRQWRCAL